MKSKSVLSFVLLLFLPLLMFSQNKKIEKLKIKYGNLEDGKEKVQTIHQLFKATIHLNKKDALGYIKEELELSNKIKYESGIGLAYRDFGYYYQYLPKIDSSRYYYEKSIETFKKYNKKRRLVTALDRYATLEVVQGEYGKALKLVDESIVVAEELKSGKMLAEGYLRKSTIYLNRGDFASAMEVVLKAAETSDTIKPQNLYIKGVVQSDIGRVESHRGNYKAAIKPTKNAIKLFKEAEDEKWEMIATNQLGNVYWYLADYNNALKYYEISYAMAKKMSRESNIGAALNNIGAVYAKQGNHRKALEMYYDGHEITEKVGSKSNLITSFQSIGESHYELKNYNEAIKNYNEGIVLGEEINALDDLNYIYKSRSETYEKMGNYALALNDHKKHQIISDSIFNKTSNDKIEELKTKYETEKKENEIIILKGKEKVSKSHRQLLYFALISLFILASLLYYGIRQKLKRSKLIRQTLDIELNYKKKELTTHALHIAKKNETLENIKNKIEELKSTDYKNGYRHLLQTINFDLQDDNNWGNFKKYFDEVHKDFNGNVKNKFPEVTSNELRLMSLLKMNLTSKEIANILNISHEGIKKARYRLRKKLNMTTDDSLQDLVMNL